MKKEKKKQLNVVQFNLIAEQMHASYAWEQCSLKADLIHQF